MKTIRTLTATVGILLALAGPTLAASRDHRAADAYASGDRSGAYNYGPVSGQTYGAQGGWTDGARTPSQAFRSNGSAAPNLPYPDRPYGAPDRD